jgi:hypothetical protein
MNKEEMSWLLQTINDPERAKRFVLAQYERGRISFQVMADVARNGIGPTARRIGSWQRRPITLRQNFQLLLPGKSSRAFRAAFGEVEALFRYPKTGAEVDRTMGMNLAIGYKLWI